MQRCPVHTVIGHLGLGPCAVRLTARREGATADDQVDQERSMHPGMPQKRDGTHGWPVHVSRCAGNGMLPLLDTVARHVGAFGASSLYGDGEESRCHAQAFAAIVGV